MTKFKTWAEQGPPKGTLYHYPNPDNHQSLSVAGWPAPPKIAVQIFTQGVMTKMTLRHMQGEPMEKTLSWAEDEWASCGPEDGRAVRSRPSEGSNATCVTTSLRRPSVQRLRRCFAGVADAQPAAPRISIVGSEGDPTLRPLGAKRIYVRETASATGQSRHFGPVRRMYACPLTAAREQTFRDRSSGHNQNCARMRLFNNGIRTRNQLGEHLNSQLPGRRD